jgi:dTDP-4-amino-4,6-dideoxygalactose transaminase
VTGRSVPIAIPSLGEEEWEALRGPIESGWLTQGPRVHAFEEAFASHHGVAHALATTSCTTALHLSLVAAGVGPGDEVIVPSFTWVASANAAAYCGATPVLVDVDRSTFNIDAAAVEAAVTERTRAVVAVHLFGRCADVPALRRAVGPDVVIVEDAACAAGASDGDRMAGGIGDVAAFSFHPRKSITTGEGGMVTTDDPVLAATVDSLRNHGASVSEEVRHQGPRPYDLPDFDVLGFNYRMTDLQGAIGLVQLGKLERFVAERDERAQWYGEALADLEWLRTPTRPARGNHAWQSYVCYVDPATAPVERDELMERLAARGVSTRPGTHAIHELGYYRERFGWHRDALPASRDCAAQTMAIPLHNRMAPEDYEHVVQAIHAAVS